MLHPRFPLCIIAVILFSTAGFSQTTATEFPKEFIAHLKVGTGLIAVPNAPEYFQGTLQVVPQLTIVPYGVRGGVVAAAVYSGRQVHGLFGPTASLKLSEFKGGYFGSLGNLHLNFDHLWGTADQRLAGGGINLDLLNKLVVGFSYHRDYHFNANWWGSSIAFRLSKAKKPQETFPN